MQDGSRATRRRSRRVRRTSFRRRRAGVLASFPANSHDDDARPGSRRYEKPGSSGSEHAHPAGLLAAAAGRDLELDPLAFLGLRAAAGFERREVHEDVLAVPAVDEAEALAGVEPLDRALRRLAVGARPAPTARGSADASVGRRGAGRTASGVSAASAASVGLRDAARAARARAGSAARRVVWSRPMSETTVPRAPARAVRPERCV